MINQQRLWDEDAAAQYDTPGEGMFSPEVLGPTVEVLSELARGGSAVEFAIGTGRVAIPLSAAGVRVSGIELSHAMISRLREKVGEDEIPVVQGDMAEASAGAGFSLAFLVFNTISEPFDAGRAGPVFPQRGPPSCPRRPLRRRTLGAATAVAATGARRNGGG